MPLPLPSGRCKRLASADQGKEGTRPISVTKDKLIAHAREHGLGHIAPSLSTVTVINYLFEKGLLPEDRFILSKGHGCYALWVHLAEKNEAFRMKYLAGTLPGCIERFDDLIPFSTGSLGHGLPLAVGVAFAMKLQHKPGTVFCLCGDGEMQEGSNWEALTFAVTGKLSNLCLIIDGNSLQAMTKTEKIDRQGLTGKLTGFGLWTLLIDGHNKAALADAFSLEGPNRPKAIFLRTVKGYGVEEMEGKAKWHYRTLPKKGQ